MTKNFDSIFESLLSEMMPASMMDDFGGMASKVSKKVEELPGKSQHWGPLQKLSPESRDQIVKAIISNIFTDKGNTYAPMVDDPEQLKDAIKSAISKVAQLNPEFKASGKWAVQFLADRLANKELLGNVKYTTDGGEEIKKDVTQKEMKAALNKALGDTTKSVWKKSSEPEEEKAPEATAKEEEPETKEEVKKETKMVYTKAADLSTDNEELNKAFNKLPDDTEMSWDEVVKKVGTSKALALMDAGGLSEEEVEYEVGEEEDVPELDIEDEDSPDLSNYDRIIDPYFRTTKGGWSFED